MRKLLNFSILILILSCNVESKKEKNERFDNARKSFEIESIIKLSSEQYRNGNYDKAINLLNKALKIDSESIKALGNRALSYEKNGNYSNSIYDYTKLINLILKGKGKGQNKQVEASYYYFKRAEVKFELDDFRGAINDLNYSINNGNNKKSNYHFRGLCYIKLNDFENACNDFSKSGELGNSESYTFIRKYCN